LTIASTILCGFAHVLHCSNEFPSERPISAVLFRSTYGHEREAEMITTHRLHLVGATLVFVFLAAVVMGAF